VEATKLVERQPLKEGICESGMVVSFKCALICGLSAA
jgi:hypothetical protein